MVVSWNPVGTLEATIAPIFPLITVLVPWLVIPEVPPKVPNVDAVPSGTGDGTVTAAVVKVQGFGTTPGPSELPERSGARLLPWQYRSYSPPDCLRAKRLQ